MSSTVAQGVQCVASSAVGGDAIGPYDAARFAPPASPDRQSSGFSTTSHPRECRMESRGESTSNHGSSSSSRGCANLEHGMPAAIPRLQRPRDIIYRGVDLATACASGDLPLTAMLVADGAEEGIDMFAADEEGNVPLHYACLSDNPEVITYLLRKAARAELVNTQAPAPAPVPARVHNMVLLEQRWSAAGALKAQNAAQETPLLRAAVAGSVPVVKALLDAGADMFMEDASQNTIFHNAARNGRMWALAYFLAKVKAEHTSNGNTPGGDGGRKGGSVDARDGTFSSGGTIALDASSCSHVNDAANDRADPRQQQGAAAVTSALAEIADADSDGDPASLQLRQQLQRQRKLGGQHHEHHQGHGPCSLEGRDTRLPWQGSSGDDRLSKPLPLLQRLDCDGHTALDWACYSGHTGVVRLLVERGLDPSSTDPGGKNALHWAASQGRVETCRYLVLLGLDPCLEDSDGADAFALAERHPAVASEALSLAAALRHHRGSGSGSDSGRSRCSAIGEVGSKALGLDRRRWPWMWRPRHEREGKAIGEGEVRAPTTDAGVEDGLANVMCCTGDGDTRLELETVRADAGRDFRAIVVLPERLNPTRPWVIVVYAAPVCSAWALAFVVPWWSWLILAAGLAIAANSAASLAAVIARGRRRRRRRGSEGQCHGGHHDCQELEHSPHDNGSKNSCQVAERPGRLPPLPSLLLAPEKYLGLWTGIAAAFVIFTVYVAFCAILGDLPGERFGRSPFVAEPAAYLSAGATSALATAYVATLVLTLASWWTLLAGDGRRAAVDEAKASASAPSGEAYDAEDVTVPPVGRRRTRRRRGFVFGRGDPGLIAPCAEQDMRALVDSVAITSGPPDPRTVCKTCLVRKPIRSKHCSACGFCVGRMDHHCVWINNCVGCGNHRRFFLFVLCQLACKALFLVLTVAWFHEQLSSEEGAHNVARKLVSTGYFPALLLVVISAMGMIMLTGILQEQIHNMFANLTSNERINRGRYPWLIACPGGPQFNRYDRGAWENLMEFWGIGGRGVHAGVCRRRHPRDYLEGYELPRLEPRQQARLSHVLERHAARRARPIPGIRGPAADEVSFDVISVPPPPATAVTAGGA